MSQARRRKSTVRLRCESLEDRVTPAVAFALSGTNLLGFDTASPITTQTTAITGVASGETLVGIDFRPQNGFLYGLGVNATTDTGTLYAISIRTGFAGIVGTAGSITFTTDGTTAVDLPDPATIGYGFDFNPAADRVRVAAGNLNFRIDPNTGLGVDGDNTGLTSGAVTGTNPDGPIAGGTTTVDATAYTNNQQNTTVTTQYTLDAGTDQLFIQNPSNVGTQTLNQAVTLGGSSLNFTAVSGFDIPAGVNDDVSGTGVPNGSAFAVLNVLGVTGLYSINLVNAQATLVGNVGNGTTAVQGLAIQSGTGGLPAVSLVNAFGLVRFSTAAPQDRVFAAIAGFDAGSGLVGIDWRPATGQLYGLGVSSSGDTFRLYRIDPQSNGATTPRQATATPVGAVFQINDAAGTVLNGGGLTNGGYGFDFNPTVDRIRVTSATGLNFRINPINGTPFDTDVQAAGNQPDGTINGSGSTGVSATAYTNSFGTGGSPVTPAGTTTQYTIDTATDTLFIQSPPNNGTQTAPIPLRLGGLAVDFVDANGFDIPAGVGVGVSGQPATGLGYFIGRVNGANASFLYSVDLATGAVVQPGTIPVGNPDYPGLALGDAPVGTVAFQSATFSGTEGGMATLTLTRTGGSVGSFDVIVTATGGSATAGSDFTAGPYTVTFADGATTATLTIPIATDSLNEGNETTTLTLLASNNGSVRGAQATATLTITDVPPMPPILPAPQSAAIAAAGGPGTVNLYSAAGPLFRSSNPYAGYAGPVTIAVGDVTGDGVEDIITGASVNGHVKVFDGVSGAEIRSFIAYGGSGGGVSVGAVDVDGDGFADILTGASVNGHVKAFSGATGAEIRSFFAYAGFTGAVTVAGGDIDGDGFADILTGASVNGHVKAFSGATGAEIRRFFAYAGFTGAVTVAGGDLDGDGFADILTGASINGHVKAFGGTDGSELSSFFAYEGFSGGVRVAGGDVDGDGRDDIITGAGPGAGPHVKAFRMADLLVLRSFFAFGTDELNGVFVG